MAQLLGSRFCIESLRNDVTDLQGAVVDVLSRTGPIKTQSWKYPDKTASDLDLTELLELYDYSEDEEERQVSHIVLLELVIDRLVLLVQSVTRYLAGMSPDPGLSPNKDTGPTSVGLTAKRFWARMLQANTYMTNLNLQCKASKKKASQLQEKIEVLEEQLLATRAASCEAANAALAASNMPIPLNEADSRAALRCPSAYCVSRDESNKACQTYETAFVPCESCHLTQNNLRETGKFVISVCKAQGLPSSLLKHREFVGNVDWMSGTDVARWTAEQNKDLARISKHLEQLEGTINPLKDEVENEQKKGKEIQNKMAEVKKEIQLEKETQVTQRKQYEKKIATIEREKSNAVGIVVREKDRLEKNRQDLQGQLEKMKEQLSTREQLYNQLEAAKLQVEKDMAVKLANNEQVENLEGQLSDVTSRLEETKQHLDRAEQECKRERAKNDSVTKHTQSLQQKQEGLLSRLDELDRENDELRQEVADLEEERETLQEARDSAEDKRRAAQRELKEHKAMISRLEQEKSSLETSMQELRKEVTQLQDTLQEAKEQQRILVEYPDLNGPVMNDVMGTGDVSQDMENQVKANSVRIQILEQQNASLRHSISKMLQATQSQHTHNDIGWGPQKPVPLWNPDSAVFRGQDDVESNGRQENYHSNSPSDPEMDSPPQHTNTRTYGLKHTNTPTTMDSPYKGSNAMSTSHKVKKLPPRPPSSKKQDDSKGKVYESFVVGKSTRENSTPKPKSRPSSASNSGSKMSQAPKSGTASTSSIAAYMQLKNAGMINAQYTKLRPISGKRTSPPGDQEDHYESHDMYVCHKCDKMYHTQRDLEVHKSYCYGGI